MKRLLTVSVLAAMCSVAGLAHEGHDHKFMGTVAMIHDADVQVKDADGKSSTIMLNDKTRILRGAERVKAADIKAGDRVVVTATQGKDKAGHETFTATEVRLGTAAAAH